MIKMWDGEQKVLDSNPYKNKILQHDIKNE